MQNLVIDRKNKQQRRCSFQLITRMREEDTIISTPAELPNRPGKTLTLRPGSEQFAEHGWGPRGIPVYSPEKNAGTVI